MPRKRKHDHRRKKGGKSRHRPRRRAISPFELIREDFQRMLYTMRLRTTEQAAENILMQSCEGHAQMGHGAFAGRRFPNTEMDDIVRALGRNPLVVAEQRQNLIDEVVDWVDLALEGKSPTTLVNQDGDGLIGCGLLRQIEVDPSDVLRGIYLGGLRDDSEIRAQVERQHGIRIGGGRMRFINLDIMEQMDLDGDQLATGEHASHIDAYKREGLIVEDPGPGRRDDHIRYMYVRERLGGGASDDAALVAAGKLYNLSVALGAFVADAIDTLEKFVVDYADQDDDLARHIERNFDDLNLSIDDVYRLIWLNAVPPELTDRVPDSSLRHLLQIDKDTDQTALESHLAYLTGRPYSPMVLGHEDIPNTQFYEWFEGRMKECPI
ncbi:MAG: hypothetical protein JSV79_01310 [Armatimonadota bacterium]|nr:MAG: hypothetical protein JSV79_01310 [Armatimonadota bacterium]